MLKQNKGKIYTCDLRSWTQTKEGLFTDFPLENNSFGTLKSFQEHILSPSGSILIERDIEQDFMILPLYGELTCNGELLQPNHFYCIKNTSSVSIVNQLKDEKADFLVLQFSTNTFEYSSLTSLDFSRRNLSNILVENEKVKVHIGLFDGRKEALCANTFEDSCFVAMVISGAFEVQNRLLETRDAIALWNISALDFEALSENAIIFFLEIRIND